MPHGRENTGAARANLVSLNIACPHCAARYELPPRLLGPGGAAVRCPRCSGQFTVTPEGGIVAGAPGKKSAGTPGAATEAGSAGAGPRPAEAAADPRPDAASAASRPAAEAARPRTPGPAHATPARGETQARTQATARGAQAARTPQAPPPIEASIAWRAQRVAPIHASPSSHDEDEGMASDPNAIARRVLDELAAKRGPAMEQAKARGRMFAEFGPELSAAFDEYRRLCGGTGNPAPFRAVLRERWGIDLG